MTSVDAHAHIFTTELPRVPGSRYAPSKSAPLSEFLRHLDAHGLSHGVLTQVSFLGTDNGYLLSGLAEAPHRLRGIAVVDPALPGPGLAELAARGVVGLRLNLIGGEDAPDLRHDPWASLLARCAELGWSVHVHRRADRLPEVLDALLDIGGLRIAVDHYGRPDPRLGIDDPGFRALLGYGPTRRVWVKLSASYRMDGARDGEDFAVAATTALRDCFGLHRLLWASDWPHTGFQDREWLDYASVADQRDRILPDFADRATVLGASASELFGIDEPSDKTGEPTEKAGEQG